MNCCMPSQYVVFSREYAEQCATMRAHLARARRTDDDLAKGHAVGRERPGGVEWARKISGIPLTARQEHFRVFCFRPSRRCAARLAAFPSLIAFSRQTKHMADVIKTFETALRQAESSIKMIDHTKKTVANNEQNVRDSEAGAPGASPLEDVRPSFRSAFLESYLITTL